MTFTGLLSSATIIICFSSASTDLLFAQIIVEKSKQLQNSFLSSTGVDL